MSLDYSMVIIQRGMVERTCSNNAKQVKLVMIHLRISLLSQLKDTTIKN
jgi:hypothetical protein